MADGFWSIKKGLNFTGFTMPTNPVNGDVYYDSVQGFLGYQNGSWGPLGGSGSINYDTNPNIGSTNGYNLYNNGAVAQPTTGTGGTATGLTFVSTQTMPLVGHTMGVLTKSAVNAQGQGLSYDFETDLAYSPGIMAFSFAYQASSGFVLSSGQSGSDSDIELWIYDITNDVVIPVTPYTLTSGVAQPSTFTGYFQTNANSTSYRLIWHVATTNASAWTFNLARVSVGPTEASAQGAIPQSVFFRAQSVGQNVASGALLNFSNVLYDTNNAYDPSTGLFTAPYSGYYIAGSSCQTQTGGQTSIVAMYSNGSNSINGGGLYMQDDSGRSGDIGAGSGPIYVAAGGTIAFQSQAGATTTFDSSSTIWVASVSLTQGQASTSGIVKLHVSTSANGNTGSGTGTVPGVPIIFDSVDEDNFGAYDATTGIWTCPVSGTYLISAQQTTDHISNYSWQIDVAYTPLGGSQISIANACWAAQISGSPSYQLSIATTRHMDLRAGDQIQVQNTGETGNNPRNGNPGNFLDIIQVVSAGLNPSVDGTPVGVALDFMGPLSKVPLNYLPVDGSSQLISDYPILANKLFDPSTGNFAWGSADSLHFNLPPGGVFYRSVDLANAFDPDSASRIAVASGGNTGNNVGSYQQNQNLSHNHTGPNVNNTNPGASSAFGSGRTGSWTTDASGGNQSNPNNVYVMKIIKYQ